MGTVCERVRAQLSIELDGELSQLERAMVDRHLRRCAACAVYRDEVTSFTRALRAVPTERAEHPVSISRQRRVVRLPIQAGAAAAFAAVAVGLAAQLSTGSERLRPSFASGVREFPTHRQIERERELFERARPVNAPQGARDTIR